MSGLEVLGAASSASNLLESAINTISRIRRAQTQQKELAGVLVHHSDQVENTRDILALIENEDALRTAKVASEVGHVKVVAEELITFLKTIDPGNKGTARQFAHQLIHGSKDEKALLTIMQKLNHARSSLMLRMQVALVGVAKTVENKLIANTVVITRIDEVLKEVFGDGKGLKLAELISNKPVENDTVVLSDADIQELGEDAAGGDASLVVPTSRIVIENTSEEQAFQINGPIGKEGWWEVSKLEIRKNQASGQSIQINHGTSMEVFDKLLANRGLSMGV